MHQSKPYATAVHRGAGWFAPFFLAVLLACHPPTVAAVTNGATKAFDVPAGDAISALKRTAQQAGMEIMFPAELAPGVKTNAVKGDFLPQEAFDRLTAGTGLLVVQDEPSGALIVKRQPAAPRN